MCAGLGEVASGESTPLPFQGLGRGEAGDRDAAGRAQSWLDARAEGGQGARVLLRWGEREACFLHEPPKRVVSGRMLVCQVQPCTLLAVGPVAWAHGKPVSRSLSEAPQW